MVHFLRILDGAVQPNLMATSTMVMIQCVLLQSLRGDSIEIFAYKILIKLYSYPLLYRANCVCQN